VAFLFSSFSHISPRPESTIVDTSSIYPMSEHCPVTQKALLLAGSFAYQIPIVQLPDGPSRENPFANRDYLLVGFLLPGT
jgi:hypothetical protein